MPVLESLFILLLAPTKQAERKWFSARLIRNGNVKFLKVLYIYIYIVHAAFPRVNCARTSTSQLGMKRYIFCSVNALRWILVHQGRVWEKKRCDLIESVSDHNRIVPLELNYCYYYYYSRLFSELLYYTDFPELLPRERKNFQSIRA